MQRMVGVLRAKTGEHLTAEVCLAIAIRVFEKGEVWLVGNIHTAIAKFKGQRDVQVVCPHR